MSPELQQLLQGAGTHCNDEPTSDILETIPEELDMEKFNRGREFFIRNLTGCYKGMFLSLVVGLSVKPLLDVLVVTGETANPVKAFSRYLYTALHVAKWHYGNIWEKNSKARNSILFVRNKHFKARELVENQDHELKASLVYVDSCNLEEGGKINGMKKVSNTHNRPVRISQYDMSLVQAGFIGMIILYPHYCGIKCTKSELDDFVYVWRWIGYLLGIDDTNNICLDGYEQAYRFCKAIEFEIVLPSLADPPKDFERMATAFLDGVEMATMGVMAPKLKPIIAFAFEASSSPIPFKVSLGDRIRMTVGYLTSYAMYYIPGFAYLLNIFIEKSLGLRKMRN